MQSPLHCYLTNLLPDKYYKRSIILTLLCLGFFCQVHHLLFEIIRGIYLAWSSDCTFLSWGKEW